MMLCEDLLYGLFDEFLTKQFINVSHFGLNNIALGATLVTWAPKLTTQATGQ